MNRMSLVIGTCVCLALGSAAGAQPGPTSPRVQMPRQGPPMPPRDTSAGPATPAPVAGTASMSGRVVAADSGEPLRRATVTAMPTRPPEPPRRGGAFMPPRSYSARTDDDGRFTIRELPAGEYALTARRAGYVEMSYGQVTTNTPPRRVTVADGAALAPLDFQLIRGGVITGRVMDESGEPAERVQVRLVRSQRLGGQVRLVSGGMSDSTDDLGQYRLFGLAPGEYLVVAEPGDRRGSFRGSNVQGVDVDTIQTYGPGTVDPAEAQKVQVLAGVEAAMDIQLVAARVATVRGRVLTSAGEPLTGGFVRLQSSGGDFVGMGRGGPVMGEGEFEIDGVAPGTYTLVAQAQPTRAGSDPEEFIAVEAAVQPITVEGEDVTVTLTTTPGSTARGRVIVEGDASALANRDLRVMGFPAAGAFMMFGPPARGRVGADLSFEMRGLRGQQILSIQSLPEDWWVKDVRVGGQSAIEGFDFGSGRAFSGVEVVLSSRPTGLAGTVTLPTGATASDYAVVLFPEDESKWDQPRPGMMSARIVRPGLDGAFRMPGLRPGSYYVLAVPAAQAEYQALTDPEQLRTLAARARTVDVKEGEMSPLSLTMVER